MAIRSVDLGVQQASARLAPKPDPSVTHKRARVVVEPVSRVRLSATPWTTARQASLSITNSRSLLRLMSIELVMPSNHLILCRPLLLPPSIFPSIRVFSTELSGDLCGGKAQDPPEDALGSPSPRIMASGWKNSCHREPFRKLCVFRDYTWPHPHADPELQSNTGLLPTSRDPLVSCYMPTVTH